MPSNYVMDFLMLPFLFASSLCVSSKYFLSRQFIVIISANTNRLFQFAGGWSWFLRASIGYCLSSSGFIGKIMPQKYQVSFEEMEKTWNLCTYLIYWRTHENHWNYESWSLCVHSIKSSVSRFSWQTAMCGTLFYIMNALLLFMFTLIRYRALSHLRSYLPLSKLPMCDFVVQAFALC